MMSKQPFQIDFLGGVQVTQTYLYADDVRDLICAWTDGVCPVCHIEINDGAIICDECLDRAQSFRRNDPPQGDERLDELIEGLERACHLFDEVQERKQALKEQEAQ
jgi:hypothetical protein